MQPKPEPQAIRFGVFEVHLRSRELFKNGSRVRLTDKPFQVLEALIERPGRIVLRDELRDRLWSADTFVDFDNNLNAAVRKLREALGDSADSPRFVETLPRRGYRFIAPVEAASAPPTDDRASTPGPRPTGRRIAGALVLVLAAVAAGRLLDRGDPVAEPPTGKLLLAVMPFANLDDDETREFFSDGLTEELIAQLGRLQPERLGVIARLSSMQFKGSGKSIEEIGDELGVHYVLEGSVRSAGNEIRVTAQLIQVSDQTHLWSELYDRRFEHLLDVQQDVARRVAGSLALELLPGEPRAVARAATGVTEAYEQYLRGRHQWSRWNAEGYRAAIEHFDSAIRLDPGFALAHAGLADAYNLLAFTGVDPTDAFSKARAAALEALRLDPDLAEAHNSIGFVRLYLDYDAEAAESAFRRAVQISPNYAMAHHWRAGALSVLGRHDEAIDAVTRSLRLDPVSLSVMSDLGWYYLFADRPAEALDVCLETLAREPDYGWARSCRFEALVRLGRLAEALALFRGEASERGVPDQRLTALDTGDPATGLEAARRMTLEERRASGEDLDPVWLAMDYAAAGEPDEAFALLEQGLGRRNPWLVFLRVDPRFDVLAADPRYAELGRRIGLP